MRKTIQEVNVKAVVTFNKGIFNLVSSDPVRNYICRLANGEQIRGNMKDFERDIPIFLTYPTGWRFHEQYMQLRKDSLVEIRAEIYRKLGKAQIRI